MLVTVVPLQAYDLLADAQKVSCTCQGESSANTAVGNKEVDAALRLLPGPRPPGTGKEQGTVLAASGLVELVLLQLEVPLVPMQRTARAARAAGCEVWLKPSPHDRALPAPSPAPSRAPWLLHASRSVGCASAAPPPPPPRLPSSHASPAAAVVAYAPARGLRQR